MTRKLGLDLEDGLPLLLVFGGSQGARTINRAVWQAAPTLLPACQILHVIGTRDWPLLEKEGPDLPFGITLLAYRYHPVPYLHEEMAWALASRRPGGRPCRGQRAGRVSPGAPPVGPRAAARRRLPPAPPTHKNWPNPAALIIIEDGSAGPERLEPTIAALLADESRRLAMGTAVGALAKPQAADNIARELQRLVAQRLVQLHRPPGLRTVIMGCDHGL